MFFVYIVASGRNGTLYLGQTNNLVCRIEAHKAGEVPGFTRMYKCDKLVWFETHNSRESAFKRERCMKNWKRDWKIRQIVKLNPRWDDLFPSLTEDSICDETRQYDPETL